MNDLPYGWSEQYALRQMIADNKQLLEAMATLNTRLESLEAELARLDMTKADRKGRKQPQPIAQGYMRAPKLGENA